MKELPFLGAGLSFRHEMKDDTLRELKHIDFLEFLTDHYIDMPPHKRQEALSLGEQIPIVLHGVELSIGTSGHIDWEYWDKVKQVAEWTRARWISDHLCFTRVPGLNIGQLTPLPFTPGMAESIARNVAAVAATTDRPVALENISYYFHVPPSSLTESQFIRQVVQASGCWLLLDLTNVQNNAINNHYDPLAFLDELPLDRVLQIHLAGGYYHRGILLDTHSHPVPPDVFSMLRAVAGRMPNLRGVIIERDQNFPKFSELLAELDQIRDILATEWHPRYGKARPGGDVRGATA
jgi:uncharacterized protein